MEEGRIKEEKMRERGRENKRGGRKEVRGKHTTEEGGGRKEGERDKRRRRDRKKGDKQ